MDANDPIDFSNWSACPDRAELPIGTRPYQLPVRVRPTPWALIEKASALVTTERALVKMHLSIRSLNGSWRVALRWNHYDVAFEAFLRERRNPYVAVDERRRALAENATLKSLDFIVYSATGLNLLVDVKGRRFPTGGVSRGQRWENWVTEDDLESMLRWEHVFGDGFRAALVFAYDLVGPESDSFHAQVWPFGRRQYSFYGVWAADYAASMRTRSPSWETVSIPMARFEDLRRPIDEFLTSAKCVH